MDTGANQQADDRIRVCADIYLTISRGIHLKFIQISKPISE